MLQSHYNINSLTSPLEIQLPYTLKRAVHPGPACDGEYRDCYNYKRLPIRRERLAGQGFGCKQNEGHNRRHASVHDCMRELFFCALLDRICQADT